LNASVFCNECFESFPTLFSHFIIKSVALLQSFLFYI
jgi:hypothetical protein